MRGELWSIQQPNKVDILLNGQRLVTLDVTWNLFKPFRSIPLRLKANENTIEFVSHRPAIQIPTDRRPLAVAVKNLSVTDSADGATICELQD
jgi:hypothetical protein